MPTLNDITGFLDEYLEADGYPEEKANGTFYLPTDYEEKSIHSIALALEPPQTLAHWIKDRRLDAVLLHRPWNLDTEVSVPVIAYHLAFDEHLTCGYNLRLATLLGLENVEVLGHKEGRPLGMIGTLPDADMAQLLRAFASIFGGLESKKIQTDTKPERICVMGAMNKTLVREAHEQGATLYLTGQYRDHAEEAVLETGMNVVATGHQRSERYGLRALAGLLRERFAGLDVFTW